MKTSTAQCHLPVGDAFEKSLTWRKGATFVVADDVVCLCLDVRDQIGSVLLAVLF